MTYLALMGAVAALVGIALAVEAMVARRARARRRRPRTIDHATAARIVLSGRARRAGGEYGRR